MLPAAEVKAARIIDEELERRGCTVADLKGAPKSDHGKLEIASRAELVARAGEVLSWVKSGILKVRIEHEFSLAEAAEAHRALEARKTTGKLLLIP